MMIPLVPTRISSSHNDHVVDTFSLPGDVRNEVVVSLVVAVAGRHEALWCSTIPVSAPLGDEGGEVTVLFS